MRYGSGTIAKLKPVSIGHTSQFTLSVGHILSEMAWTDLETSPEAINVVVKKKVALMKMVHVNCTNVEGSERAP